MLRQLYLNFKTVEARLACKVQCKTDEVTLLVLTHFMFVSALYRQRSQIKVHTDKWTQVHSARSSLRSPIHVLIEVDVA